MEWIPALSPTKPRTSTTKTKTHVEGGELEEGEEEVVERVVVRGKDAGGVHLLQGRVELADVQHLK
jgi:hypothetical protein